MISEILPKFLFKGKSGIKIGNEYDGLECLNSFMETVYYAKFAHFKEPLNFCGPSSYKTFLAQKFLIGAPVLNLYPETTIGQLLGSVSLVNNIDAKTYYLEEILPSKDFIRISNSAIININQVKCFNTSIIGKIIVKFKDGSEESVSRRKTSEIMKFLKDRSDWYEKSRKS